MAKLFKIIGAFLLVALIVAGVMFFGPPQLHKWIYMTQAYVYPRKGIREMHLDILNSDYNISLIPPSNYSGTWLTWYKSGKLASKRQYAQGQVIRMIAYYESGRTQWYGVYNANDHTVWRWHSNGRLSAYEEVEEPNWQYCEWDINGTVLLDKENKNGVLIRNEGEWLNQIQRLNQKLGLENSQKHP